MLNRRVTRTVYNTTEVSSQTVSPDSTPLAFELLDTDVFYVGVHAPFASRYIQVGTANTTAATLTVNYWNGSDWTPVDDLLDQTSVGGVPLARSGFLSWTNTGQWQASNVTGTDADLNLYWIQITTDTSLFEDTTIRSVLNLFSDDNLLSSYYPELISDTRYLPTGHTNFLPQHVAAKDLVVLRLKQRKLIDDESQVIDINAVAIAAVHALAWIILAPIASSESVKERADDAKAAFAEEINRTSLHIDRNKDGVVSEVETREALSVINVRRG